MEISPKSYIFHVHHKFYILTRLPWEYENSALITFCNWCHSDWHVKNEAPVFKSDTDLIKCNLTLCDRCNGVGIFPEYRKIQNGICFKCKGYKYLELVDRYEI